jgi:hypothetical protein
VTLWPPVPVAGAFLPGGGLPSCVRNVKRSDGTERLHLDDLAGTSAWIYRQGLSDVSRLNQCIVENEYHNFVGTGDRVEHHRWPLFPVS